MAKFKSAGKSKSTGKPTPKSKNPAEVIQAKAEVLSRSIMDSAQQIWMAGMGAFGRAQNEGTKMFENLVSEGMTLEKRTRNLASGRVDAVRDAVESRVGQVKERATDTWDRLEKVFEDRVQRALVRLGVPSREDLKALIKRVDQLNAELRKIGPAPAKRAASKAPAKATKRAASKKSNAKPAAAKKAAGKKAVKRAPRAAKAARITDATD